MSSNEYRAQVGAWMRSERARLGIKQSALASELGVSDATVSSWERGRVAMSSYTHARITALFRRAATARQEGAKA